MLDQYPAYLASDSVFYESPAVAAHDGEFAAATRDLPAGWRRGRRQIWTNVDPVGLRLPAQGWKVHVSTRLEDAEQVLDIVWEHCLAAGLPFKFLPNRQLLRMVNAKYMPRESSGKFIAIYPSDDDQLRRALDGLSSALAGFEGPQILSDLRWGAGPLHVRYGGFRERYCVTPAGDCVPAMVDPQGRPVPDRRRPVFSVPEWVEPPAFISAELAARRGTPAALPYRVTRALHFSNGGGVYLADRLSDGAPAVLKEARPHAGLDRYGRDAVQRLRREHEVLRRLDGIEGVPRAYECLEVGGHHFLAMELVPGDIIWKWSAAVHPMVSPDPTADELAVYTRRATTLADALGRLLDRIHDRGIVYGDLHPGNILVTPDDRVHLVDFEACGEIGDEDYQPGLGAAGFASWDRDTRGAAVDRRALSVLRLWLFHAQDRLWELDPGRLAVSIDEAERRFTLPAGTADALRRELLGRPVAGRPVAVRAAAGRPLEVDLAAPQPDLATAVRSAVDAVLASATPDRTDRLFPGDIGVFNGGGASFATGAAGVLWALDRAGFGRHPGHEQWLLDAAERGLRPQPGFYTGLHGTAHVLAHFGHRDAALALVEQAAPAARAVRDVSLHKGLAGIGLNLLHLGLPADDVAERLEHALAAAADAAGGGPAGRPPAAPTRPGLLHGWTGPALFFVRVFEAGGDERWLDAAVRALHRDLDRCVPHRGMLLAGEDGGRALPYLATGTAGIGLVAGQVLRHRPVERLRAAMPAILQVFQPEFVAESGLLEGRAGLLAALSRLSLDHPGAAAEQAVARHVHHLSWYAVSYRGHLAFPARRQLRLGMDLATGTAGVLLALAAVQDRKLEVLPFLERSSDA